MKLWVFLFTESSHRLQSARVAAPDKSWARGLLGAEIGEDLTVARGVLCHWAGKVDRGLGVIEQVARDQGSGIRDQGSGQPPSDPRFPIPDLRRAKQ